tara:strand:+ start:76 stop:855 length:780 start_codon:yes stop_codon:yes gene_type:complete
MINVKNMSFKYYNNPILHDISLQIDKKEKVLLIGRNGAGKSTLIRVLAGIHNTFNYDVFDVMGKKSPMDQFNGLAYLGNRWVRNISFIGRTPYMADIKVRDMMKNVQNTYLSRRNELVDVLDINLDWKMHQISDGQRKKVQIMLALIKPFKLILIDEFVSELDILARDKLFAYLNKEDATILYATHIFDDVDRWITHVIYISNGRCSEKIPLHKFLLGDTIYNKVKEKFLSTEPIRDSVYNTVNLGPQGGWGSGRSNNI